MTARKLFNAQLSRDKIIFIILLTFAVICLIAGIVLVALGSADYLKFVELHLEKSSKQIQISKFIYGIFLLIWGVLLLVLSALFGNSQFNKKLNKNE
ncbi:Uncharacterised protein [Mycoplasmopsis citelli]|uniref:Uncharacterized protein n=1 Tax=Mycoplasmopsis citelli TaxID=171281 RepID=A0A449B377_9BACT|nr:hypothetical protein [Mycoplasmopsis citelli]VEU75057.1 Uncharacterised protein [Mycoplasmopsis citelli]